MNTLIDPEKAQQMMRLAYHLGESADKRAVEETLKHFEVELIDCLKASAPNILVARLSTAFELAYDTTLEKDLLRRLSDYESSRLLTSATSTQERSEAALDLHYRAWLSGEHSMLEEASITLCKAKPAALGYYMRANLFEVLRRNETFGQNVMHLPAFYDLHMLAKTVRDNMKGATDWGPQEMQPYFVL